MTHPNKIKIVEPFLFMVFLGVALIYGVNAFNTGNWLWFSAKPVNTRPNRIVIVDHGSRITYLPGHTHFDALADAAELSLSELNNTDLVSIGLSEQTLSDYATDSLVVELYYDKPVIFNSLARTGEPKQLLIPVTGRHSEGGYFFRGDNGEWWYGALRMADPSPLFSVLSEMGFSDVARQPVAGPPAGQS